MRMRFLRVMRLTKRSRNTLGGRDISPSTRRERFFPSVNPNGAVGPRDHTSSSLSLTSDYSEALVLRFDSRSVAMTGYVLARDSWGRGYATEALMAIVHIAQTLQVLELYALCHSENVSSARVLDKCGFLLETRLERYLEFPNLTPHSREDCLRYVLRHVVSPSAGSPHDGELSMPER
jgi:hypothetical protein